ncbi:MAG: hypothetical protein QME96_14480 [Myxococcota bacterium]|nr:hypothetical protein [Myxococcota bacterium]
MTGRAKGIASSWTLASLAVALAAGCTGEQAAGTGDLTVAVNGGAAVRDGFPYDEGGSRFAFVDGWTLSYTAYVVAVGNLRLTDPEDGSETAAWTGHAAMDLRKDPAASVDLATLAGLPALRQDFGFDIVPVSATTENRNVEPTNFEEMQREGWSLLAAGTATHPVQGTVRFRFGLPIRSRYSTCINGVDRTQGVAVAADSVTGVFIYAHAIHMFWDTLATGDEDLRFDAFAAMHGADDLVTAQELLGQDLNDLLDADGEPLRDGTTGRRIFYNDGGRLPPGEQTLYHFVLEAMRQSAHFNGVGLCTHHILDS